jgi:hypothetical protein
VEFNSLIQVSRHALSTRSDVMAVRRSREAATHPANANLAGIVDIADQTLRAFKP